MSEDQEGPEVELLCTSTSHHRDQVRTKERERPEGKRERGTPERERGERRRLQRIQPSSARAGPVHALPGPGRGCSPRGSQQALGSPPTKSMGAQVPGGPLPLSLVTCSSSLPLLLTPLHWARPPRPPLLRWGCPLKKKKATTTSGLQIQQAKYTASASR